MLANIRNKLKTGRPTIGSWMQIPHTAVAAIMGRAGYDWVAVDLEHGAFSRTILPDVFRTLSLGGALPFARVARAEADHIKIALDAGAAGLIFPMIETGNQLAEAIDSAFYPPVGSRGVGYCPANAFGSKFAEYLDEARNIFIAAQLEHVRALDNLDDILTAKALDAVMVGPYDLSGSLGAPGDFEHPRYIEAMKIITAKCKEHKLPMGLHVVQPDPAALQARISEGYQFLAYGLDAVFLNNSAACPRIAEALEMAGNTE